MGEAKAKAEAEAKALAEAEKRQKEEEQQKQKDEERKLQLKKQAKAAEEKQQEAERQKLEEERKDAEKLAQESKRISSSPDDKSPSSEENKTEVVVMRRSRAPMHSSSENTIPKHNRHSMAENQIEADGYSRYTSNPTDQQPKRKTLCESGMLTADQLMQQLNEDEKRRKASYSMLMRTGEEPKPSTLSDASSYIPSSMSRRDEPVYYSRDSRTRLLHSQSSNVLNKEQDLKDEALAIRLAADIASKRALDDVTKSPNSTSGSSSSRQRIRDILQKQREDQEKRKDDQEVERKVSSAFDPSSRKLLWVFR